MTRFGGRRAPRCPHLKTESLGTLSVDPLELNEIVPPERVAELLKLRRTAKVVYRDRRYLVDNVPVLATTYVPPCPGTPPTGASLT